MSTTPLRPRLVLRAGFAGRKDLSVAEQASLATALHEVLTTLGDELAGLTPGVPVRAGREPRVAAFLARTCPLLRLVTGLCEGADAVAWQVLEAVHIAPDKGAPCGPDTSCVETELAAVLPFDVETYRSSRPATFLSEFDRQLARCAWVLALDGIFEKPNPPTKAANNQRARAYRAQSSFLLRHSDILIAAANPDEPGSMGGTMETTREALAFDLPVVFIHTGTGTVHLIAPEDDLHDALAAPAINREKSREKLRRWVRQLTADPDSGLSPDEHGPDEHGPDETLQYGEALLEEFFDHSDSPAKDAAWPMMRFRRWAWDWFEKRLRSGPTPTSDARLAPYDLYRDRATELSSHYSGLYRGAFLLNYVLAIAAVSLAAVSLALLASAREAAWLHPLLFGLAAVKLMIVIFISYNTRLANRAKWNDRAVDYRYLAERLRGMYYLPQAGSQQPPAAAPPQFTSRAVRQSAVDWLFDAVVRAISPADLAAAVGGARGTVPVKKLLILQPRAVVEKVRDAWIGEQAKYHDRNARTMHAMHHACEKVAVGLGWTVIAVVAIDLLLVGCEVLHWLPETCKPVVKAATPWLIFISAVLPAVTAALGGIRFQSECQRLAERSAVMRVMLQGRTDTPGGRQALADALARRIAKAQAVPATDPGSWSREALRLTERVATDFVQEAAEWSVLYAKEVSDPG